MLLAPSALHSALVPAPKVTLLCNNRGAKPERKSSIIHSAQNSKANVKLSGVFVPNVLKVAVGNSTV